MRKYHTPTAPMTFIYLGGAQIIAHAIHHGFTHASHTSTHASHAFYHAYVPLFHMNDFRIPTEKLFKTMAEFILETSKPSETTLTSQTTLHSNIKTRNKAYDLAVQTT